MELRNKVKKLITSSVCLSPLVSILPENTFIKAQHHTSVQVPQHIQCLWLSGSWQEIESHPDLHEELIYRSMGKVKNLGKPRNQQQVESIATQSLYRRGRKEHQQGPVEASTLWDTADRKEIPEGFAAAVRNGSKPKEGSRIASPLTHISSNCLPWTKGKRHLDCLGCVVLHPMCYFPRAIARNMQNIGLHVLGR